MSTTVPPKQLAPADVSLRVATRGDAPFLRRMLFEAFFWQPEHPRPPMERFAARAEFAVIFEGWGDRAGDTGIIAESRPGQPCGAIWARFYTHARHTYGFVQPTIPELGIAVCLEQRGEGVGSLLLRRLLERCQAAGFPAVSLSVDPRNRARHLYERAGFFRIGTVGTSWTMLKYLT